MTNLLQCVIIDDDAASRKRMKELIGMVPNVRVGLVSSYSENVLDRIQIISPNIIFIEVELKDKDGFEIVDELKEKGINAEIVFINACSRYSIRAIKHGAFDYLLKPIDIDELKLSIKRIAELPGASDPDKINQVLEQLTNREKEIAILLMQGKSSKEIAEYLCISKNTVDTHRRKIIDKTGVSSTIDLITKTSKD